MSREDQSMGCSRAKRRRPFVDVTSSTQGGSSFDIIGPRFGECVAKSIQSSMSRESGLLGQIVSKIEIITAGVRHDQFVGGGWMRALGSTPDRVAVYREVVGRRLMSARKRAKFSLGALAREAAMSRAAVGRIEAGAASPNVEQLRRLTRALGTTTSQLFADTERAIVYLEGRRTLIVEAVGAAVPERGRLVQPPEVLLQAPRRLLQVAGPTLMREVEAALGLRPDPPRTPAEVLTAQCDDLGLPLPRTHAEHRRTKGAIAAGILDGRIKADELTVFGPSDPLMEDSAYLEVEDG
jgi:transcriptional regulator with XRE-family HTH domain